MDARLREAVAIAAIVR